jgi:hypothetical protein
MDPLTLKYRNDEGIRNQKEYAGIQEKMAQLPAPYPFPK